MQYLLQNILLLSASSMLEKLFSYMSETLSIIIENFWTFFKLKVNKLHIEMENLGIDRSTSGMLSERSTI